MGWIRLVDKKPEPDKAVLFARWQGGMKSGYITAQIGFMRKNGRISCEMDWVTATHWMELPENPKELPPFTE